MIERPVSVLRSNFRSLAGGQIAKLSVSFGEEVAPGALREAWQAVAAARPRLRFAYRKLAGEGLRAIEDPRASPEWRELDWSSLPPGQLAAQWQAEFQGVRAPDPSLAPPLRLVVITLPDRSTHLLAAHPQFVFDEEDWFDILCELLEALSGRQPVAADSGSLMPDGQPVWKELLQGFQPSPLRYHGPGEAGDFSIEMAMSRDFTAGLAAACREAGAGSGAAILACWSALLSRLTGNPRPLLLAPAGETVSLFQPFRLPALENPGLRELMVLAAGEQRRRSSCPPETFEALGLQPADAASLVRILPPSLNDRISDALPRWINLDARLHSPPLHSLELTVRSGPRLELALRGRGLPGEVARQMLGWLEDFLAGLIEGGRAGDIRLAEEIEPAPPPPPGAAPAESLFAEAALAHGDSLAIEDPTGAGLTFREVEDYASIFSGWLCGQGLGEGWIAGVCLSPSPWVPVTWIALLRAGNTLLPLDPAAAPEWLRRKAADSDAQFVVCDSSTAGHFEGCGLKIVVVDREWETIASTPLPARFPEPARTALILGGSPCQPPPLAAIPQAALSAACLRFGRLFDAGSGSRIEISDPPGTGAYADCLLGAMAAGATAIFEGASAPSHIRGSPGALRARINVGGMPPDGQLRGVAVDARLEPLDLATLDRLRRACGPGCRVVIFASPCDLAYLGIFGPAEPALAARAVLPAGKPSRAAGACFSGRGGHQVPPGFPGRLVFQPPGAPGPVEGFPAWRDEEGHFHVLPEDEEAASITVAALSLPEVSDAAVFSGNPPSLYYSAGPALSPEQLAGKLALALPGRALPRDIIGVGSIPRRYGLPDRSALEPPAPSPPPAGSQMRAPEAAAGKEADSAPASTEAAAEGRAAARQDAPAPAVKSQSPGSQSLLLDLAGRAELPRLIFIHASGRSPRDCAPLLPHLAQDWHVCGIRHYQGDPPDLTQLARGLAAEPACAEEPFHLLGVGAGGLLAFDLARALRAAGREVPFLLIAGAAPPHERPRNWIESLTRGFRAEASAPLHGPCGIILTKDLPRDAERRWLELAPDALCLSLDCRYQDLLGEAAGLLAEAISSFTSGGE